jgi:hypothetical protein
MNIGSLNLGERAEPPTGVISVVCRPGIGRFLLQQFVRIEALCDGYTGQQCKQATNKQFHFKVTR